MKSITLITLLTPLLMASSSFAQQVRLHADVPFEFAAGGTTLPAGTYTIQRAGHPSSILIRSDDGQYAVLALTNPAGASSLRGAVLTFRRDGDKYTLVSLQPGDGGLVTVAAKSDEITVPLRSSDERR
jgi:hypothetical protein